ncbi:hypothetical protein TI39_contig5905g00005 [Zymoseptoria brevis]|uniref:Uncharacterized protein n=1 Tax=Zymoseptoria brevis TaxID=1047168 RepID=A0A0F4G488_9PEZI|nr:hypothetical protein TI39_contig5905g00005 [Zymoseptoria brevis]
MANSTAHDDEHGTIDSNNQDRMPHEAPASPGFAPKRPSRYPGFRRCNPVDAPIEKIDRHRFGAPSKFQVPNPLDLTYWEALKVIEAWQEPEPFQKFAHEMKLSALNCAPTRYYASETAPVVHMLYQETRVIKVQLKVVCDSEVGWNSCTVMLKNDDEWMTFLDYLKSLPVLDFATTGQVGWWVQHQWWKSMNKTFRFSKLPFELRQRILLCAMGKEVYPRPADMTHSQLSLTQGFKAYKSPSYSELRPNIAPTNVSVLCLNKKLAAQTRDLLWQETTKVYYEKQDLSHLWEGPPPPNHLEPFDPVAMRPPQSFHFIRRLKLAFKPMDLVKLFRIIVVPFTEEFHNTYGGYPAGHTGAEIFKNLPCLHFVEFESFWHRSAWEVFEFYHADEVEAWEAEDLFFQNPACRETFTNMVMAFAAEYLQHVKTIRISGIEKLSVRERWENMLNKHSYKDNKPAIEAMKKKFSAMRAEQLPPRCECREYCDTYDYSFGKNPNYMGALADYEFFPSG